MATAALPVVSAAAAKASITVGITVDTRPDWNGPANFIARLMKRPRPDITASKRGSSLQTKQDTEAIMELTDPKLVNLIIDTGHTTMAGMDPVQLTRTYLHRIIEDHIKDVAPENKGGFRGELKEPYNTTVENRIFFEMGKGGVDFAGIKKILDDNNWKGWWTIELDRTATTARESCVIARKYIESLGLTV